MKRGGNETKGFGKGKSLHRAVGNANKKELEEEKSNWNVKNWTRK